MPKDILVQQHLLPEMKLLRVAYGPRGGADLFVCMTSPMEVCPKCATPSCGKGFPTVKKLDGLGDGSVC